MDDWTGHLIEVFRVKGVEGSVKRVGGKQQTANQPNFRKKINSYAEKCETLIFLCQRMIALLTTNAKSKEKGVPTLLNNNITRAGSRPPRIHRSGGSPFEGSHLR